VDGVVVKGHGKMNEAYLTGEPFEIAKTPGSEVLSGAVNGDAALHIRADKLAVDSRYARIMKVMQDAEQRRPHIRRLGDKLGSWYTPFALSLAGIAWAATGESHRFLAVLVVATPCPLLIAIPVAVIGAISLSARRGIIIKNPAVLEQIDRCRTLIFDKTGTLTYGKPSVSEILCAPGFMREDVLRVTASLERYSKHPLSQAILDEARKANLPMEIVSEVSERPGAGLRGTVGQRKIWITSRRKIEEKEIELPPIVSGLECLVFLDGTYAATFRFHDMPRADSRPFIRHLGPRHAVNRVLIVSGDRDQEVRRLAEQVGIKEVHSAKSPEDKVAITRKEVSQAPTLFLGDGINDAPAMRAATVGIAFGVQSDITSEAADAVILETSLARVDELIHIARRTPIKRHVKVKGEANPYHPASEIYFEKREADHMRDTFRGTRTLRYLWYEQCGRCLVCNERITRISGWRLHHCVPRVLGGSTNATNRVLLHPECHDRVHRQRLHVSKPRLS
jgi:heavy metal translocating P-type ATPase